MSMAVCHTLSSRAASYACLMLACALGCATPWTKEVRLAADERDRFALDDKQSRSAADAEEILVSDRAATANLAKATYGPPTAQSTAAPSASNRPSSTQQPLAATTNASATTPTSSAGSGPTVADAQALGQTLAELKEMGAIDAATQAQLLDSLQHTDPALWPQLLAYFKTAAERRHLPLTEPLAKPAAESAAEPPAASPVQLASMSKPAAEPTAPPETYATASDQPSEPEAKAEEAPTNAATTQATNVNTNQQTAPPPPKKKKPKRRKPAQTKQETTAEDWQQVLAASIERLEKETTQPPSTSAEVSQHAALRMMYLAAGRREDALKPIEGIPASQQDFWAKELYGLAAYLDPARNPDAGRRAAEANQHFREASARLGEIATLQVRNLSFCKEVTSYGVYKTFDLAQFQAGQELLLYAEVENFKSEHKDRGYHTALKASYQILDERGHRVDEKEFAVTEEYCQNPRRDFFVRYFIWMPQRIYGGKYTLQLTVEDTLSQKIGQSSIEFTIASTDDAAP